MQKLIGEYPEQKTFIFCCALKFQILFHTRFLKVLWQKMLRLNQIFLSHRYQKLFLLLHSFSISLKHFPMQKTEHSKSNNFKISPNNKQRKYFIQLCFECRFCFCREKLNYKIRLFFAVNKQWEKRQKAKRRK